MQTEAFTIDAADEHTIRGTHWRPSGDARGVIQIFHGLGEHHPRYARFAELATSRGLAVVAHDHRGHGAQTETLGHFADAGGWQMLIDDGLLVSERIGEQHGELPVVLLGHSMGSFIAQNYSMLHSNRLAGLILSGSSWPQKAKLYPGLLVAYIESWRCGKKGKSALLDKSGFGDFNRPFEPARTEMDWLSRDESEVDKYIADPLCGGTYSCGLWLDLMRGLLTVGSDKNLSRIRSDLPLLLTGGATDPVGGDKGITKLAMHYAQTLHSRLKVKIYPDGRHEMLNETNRDEFSEDILRWVEEQLPLVTGT